jgi:hypothetical protein
MRAGRQEHAAHEPLLSSVIVADGPLAGLSIAAEFLAQSPTVSLGNFTVKVAYGLMASITSRVSSRRDGIWR